MIHCQKRSTHETGSVYPLGRPESSILADPFRQWAKITPWDISILVKHLALLLTDAERFSHGRTEIAKLREPESDHPRTIKRNYCRA